MAFGFGFNKAKVTASAERNVKAGKLQNAIADYEKIVKEDPRDLNALNTIGDLYVRLGNNDQATAHYKRVADAYAADGFAVRAIAMYKKITKLSASPETVIKLAELYIQQGLYNDARSQYMQVAEQMLRGSDLEGAARILQKVLDLDPDNSSMQARLADVLVKLGRKTEARDIYFRNAELFRSRGQLKEADEALAKVVGIDAGFVQGLLLRGHVKLDLGDAEGAVKSLEHIADIDSRPEGLRTLLKAQLKLGNLEAAAPIAQKLLAVFGESTGIISFAEALLAAGKHASAIRVFAENADAVLQAAPESVEALTATIGHIKEDAETLEMLALLLRKSGQTSHVAEVQELLAHASVQNGELAKARDIYRELSELEPQNPLHAQNYKQVLARMGEGLPPIPADSNAAIPEMVIEDLDATAPHLPQGYPEELAEAVKAALTDADLFDSYNLTNKAIAPLERVLPRAPRDPQLHQRLATLYARAFRWTDAANSCRVLQSVYAAAGYEQHARDCVELAGKYDQQAAYGATVQAAPLAIDDEPDIYEVAKTESTGVATGVAAALPFEEPAPAGEATVAAFDFSDFSHNAGDEVDVVDELLGQVADATVPAATSAGSAASVLGHEDFTEALGFELETETTPVIELPVEIAAAAELETWGVTATPAAMGAAAGASGGVSTEFDVSEWEGILEVETPSSPVSSPTVEFEAPGVATDDDAILSLLGDGSARESNEILGAAGESLEQDVIITSDDDVLSDIVEEFRFYIAQGMTDEARAALGRIHGLDPAKADELRPLLGAPEPPQQAAPAILQESVFEPVQEPDLLGSLVLDLENSLDQVVPGAPPAPAPAVAARPAPAPAAPEPIAPPAPVVAEPDDEIGGALADVFNEFKSDMEADAATVITEDPETHYNLGVAFKEMGLLDEAIGELQKVCTAIDRGHPFPQVMQAYTWLADCFMQKGVPEAAVRWYEKALHYPHLDAETATAIHYELGSACESAGDRASALRHFMEVYGANIDYRDVAERIKQLKS